MGSLLFIAVFLFQTTGNSVKAEVPFLNESMVQEHTTYFHIADFRFEGADVLTSELQSAHYVALGELHNRVRLGELTRAFLTYLEPQGFSHFAIETGPYSANKLEQLIQSGKPAVSDFYGEYSSGLFDFVPIPFFTGTSDLEFLAVADSLGYELWGLDQEFYYSFSYLTDELAFINKSRLTTEQKKLLDQVSSKLYWWKRRAKIFSGFDMSCRLQEYEPLSAYLESFEDIENEPTNQILKAIDATLEIYCLAEQNKASSRVRIRYFKENFNAYYREASGEHQEPKVFTKIGSFHAGRQQSQLGIFDIGNHIHQLADTLSQKSVHIRYLNRFYKGDDMLEEKGWENSAKFISVGRQDKWALIDLRPLRKRIEVDTLQGTEFEKREIINYDFIIIPPEDDVVKKHF